MVFWIFLELHSWLRWAVVLAALSVGLIAASGWFEGRPWNDVDQWIARAWVGATDLQVLLGLGLYLGSSPTAEVARHDLVAAWRDPLLRFFGVLHPSLMLLAFVLTHVAWVRARRATSDRERFHRLGLGVLLVLVALALAIPWPWLAHGRPLFRV